MDADERVGSGAVGNFHPLNIGDAHVVAFPGQKHLIAPLLQFLPQKQGDLKIQLILSQSGGGTPGSAGILVFHFAAARCDRFRRRVCVPLMTRVDHNTMPLSDGRGSGGGARKRKLRGSHLDFLCLMRRRLIGRRLVKQNLINLRSIGRSINGRRLVCLHNACVLREQVRLRRRAGGFLCCRQRRGNRRFPRLPRRFAEKTAAAGEQQRRHKEQAHNRDSVFFHKCIPLLDSE